MAQNYEIDIKRFNGQDYDTLLPTPASHASTHQANGSDPLTLQTGNYGALSIPTSAYQDASVTRAKLANDALYSPIASTVANLTPRAINKNDIGKTLLFSWVNGEGSIDTEFTLSLADSSTMPLGAEIAIFFMHGKSCTIKFTDGLKVDIMGEGRADNRTVRIPEKYGMAALKKMLTSNGTDYWLVTGNVEVVS